MGSLSSRTRLRVRAGSVGRRTATDRQADLFLSAALLKLREHSADVAAAWKRRLERLQFDAAQRDAVGAVAFASHVRAIRAGGVDAYTAALEAAGQDLARQGVPEPRVLAALGAQLESSLPCASGPGELAALVRLAFAGALSLTAGYSHARATSWRSFGEQERRRLSRDLHDEIGHHLVVLKLYLGMVSGELDHAGPARIREKLDEATGLVSQAIQSVRRLILDLGPVALDGVGFLPAVKLYARQFGARTGVKVHVRDRGLPAPLPASHETAMYRLLQGALSNVLKHASARRVTVTVGGRKGSAIVMAIEDDGIGFDTAVPRQAFGLAAMRDRVASLGGRLRVVSRPAGSGARHGTRIEVELPLEDGSR
jgi:signal transduction histidine kinase